MSAIPYWQKMETGGVQTLSELPHVLKSLSAKAGNIDSAEILYEETLTQEIGWMKYDIPAEKRKYNNYAILLYNNGGYDSPLRILRFAYLESGNDYLRVDQNINLETEPSNFPVILYFYKNPDTGLCFYDFGKCLINGYFHAAKIDDRISGLKIQTTTPSLEKFKVGTKIVIISW